MALRARPRDEKDLIPTRDSLIQRLQNQHDDESWRDFFDTYWKLIYNSAIKAGLTDAEAQDVVQETVLSAWRALPQLQYDARRSFKGWLLQLTSWRIKDYLRQQQRRIRPVRPDPGTENGTRAIERIPDPAGVELEAVWDEEFELNLLEVAIERVKTRVDPRDYQIFDLYVFQEWPTAKVAETLGVGSAKVYSVKYFVGRAIKKAVKYLEKHPVNRKVAKQP